MIDMFTEIYKLLKNTRIFDEKKSRDFKSRMT